MSTRLSKCSACNKVGHIEQHCWVAHSEKQPFKNRNGSEDRTPYNSLFMGPSSSSSKDGWLLDTTTSHHICNDRKLFINYTTKETPFITTISGEIQSKGMGTIILKASDGINIALSNVLHLPSLPINLLSGQILYEKGIYFCGKTMTIRSRITDEKIANLDASKDGFLLRLAHPIEQKQQIKISMEEQIAFMEQMKISIEEQIKTSIEKHIKTSIQGHINNPVTRDTKPSINRIQNAFTDNPFTERRQETLTWWENFSEEEWHQDLNTNPGIHDQVPKNHFQQLYIDQLNPVCNRMGLSRHEQKPWIDRHKEVLTKWENFSVHQDLNTSSAIYDQEVQLNAFQKAYIDQLNSACDRHQEASTKWEGFSVEEWPQDPNTFTSAAIHDQEVQLNAFQKAYIDQLNLVYNPDFIQMRQSRHEQKPWIERRHEAFTKWENFSMHQGLDTNSEIHDEAQKNHFQQIYIDQLDRVCSRNFVPNRPIPNREAAFFSRDVPQGFNTRSAIHNQLQRKHFQQIYIDQLDRVCNRNFVPNGPIPNREAAFFSRDVPQGFNTRSAIHEQDMPLNSFQETPIDHLNAAGNRMGLSSHEQNPRIERRPEAPIRWETFSAEEWRQGLGIDPGIYDQV